MIFCVITGTPCVAIYNSNHKISGVYDTWLKECDYITFLNDADTSCILLSRQNMTDKHHNKMFEMSSAFLPLRNVLVEK